MKRLSDGILSKGGTGEKVAKLSSGGILSKEGAGCNVAKRSGGGVLIKAGAGRKVTKPSGGGMLSKIGSGRKAAKRSGGVILRHDDILEGPSRGAEDSEGIVLLSVVLWRNEYTISNRENMPPWPMESRTS